MVGTRDGVGEQSPVDQEPAGAEHACGAASACTLLSVESSGETPDTGALHALVHGGRALTEQGSLSDILCMNEDRVRESDPAVTAHREYAALLVKKAVAILSGLGDAEGRVAWLLEDCLALLEFEHTFATGQYSLAFANSGGEDDSLLTDAPASAAAAQGGAEAC